VSFDPEDLRIEGNPLRVNPSPRSGEGELGGEVSGEGKLIRKFFYGTNFRTTR